MKTARRTSMALAVLSACFLFALDQASAQVAVEVTRIGDATHLEFTGAAEWKYTLARDTTKADRVILRVKGLKGDAASKLRGLSDSLIKNVHIDEKGVDESAEIALNVSPRTDFFDYVADQPSRLIIDFFPKDESKPSKAEAKIAQKKDKKTGQKTDGQAAAKPAKKKASDARKPAGAEFMMVKKAELPLPPTVAERISSQKDFSHGIFDGGDPEFRRFTVKDYEIKDNSVIASRSNYYLPFPMLELGVAPLKALHDKPPTYEVISAETRENKEARILLQLFAGKQRALFLKAAAEFLANYPDGKYDEIMRYMVADAHYDIWRGTGSAQDFDVAMGHYLALAEKYPESPMTPRTMLLMGYANVDRGDSFGALKIFERFVRQFPASNQHDRVQIAIAEAYLRLNRFDDSYAMFDKLEKTGKTKKGREEAAYRKGDVYFRKRDYAEAIDQYRQAIAKFPQATSRFPNAYYNIAEAEFVRQKYKESLDAYRAFLQKFPDHVHGGYAMTRMGELLDILGAEPHRSAGAFRESYFRYRATPGAGVARIRSLTKRMLEMNAKELAVAIDEIDSITALYSNRPDAKKKDGKRAPAAAAHEPEYQGALKRLTPKEGEDPTRKTPELPGIEEFSTLLIADGFAARREFDTAAQRLITYHQKNPTSSNQERFKARIVKTMTESIRSSVDRGDFMDALRRYSKNSEGWLKNHDRIDVVFNVARAYEQAGVVAEAASLYGDCLKRLTEIQGKPAERERAVIENLPKIEQVELRLAAVGAKNGDFAGAESHLKKIGKDAKLDEAEEIERAEVAAQVAEARGQPEAARKYLEELIHAWKGEPHFTSPLHFRVAKLYGASRKYKEADTHLARVIGWRNEEAKAAGDGVKATKVTDDTHAQALEMRADFLVKRGKRGDAVKAYRDLLEAYESSRPLASVRYRLGQVLYQDGDLKAAEQVWSEMKADRDGLWQHLAVEQMQGAKWQNEYKKYLNRIPAAAELRDDELEKASR